jgi:hypothetical protein
VILTHDSLFYYVWTEAGQDRPFFSTIGRRPVTWRPSVTPPQQVARATLAFPPHFPHIPARRTIRQDGAVIHTRGTS